MHCPMGQQYSTIPTSLVQKLPEALMDVPSEIWSPPTSHGA